MELLVSDQSTSLFRSALRDRSTFMEAMQRVTETVGRADTDVRLAHFKLSDQVCRLKATEHSGVASFMVH